MRTRAAILAAAALGFGAQGVPSRAFAQAAPAPAGSAAPADSSAPAAPADPPVPDPALAPPAPSAGVSEPPPSSGSTCREHVPSGKDRPKLSQKVPNRATSGHAFSLVLTIEHGKGETVLPGGLQFQGVDSSLKGLEREGLFVPDPDGGAGPALERTEQGERATTRLEIPFLPLPPKPGRNSLVLPPLPVSIARASGDVLVLCTERHEISVEDPIANASNPSPKPNPAPRPQREEWTALKHALLIGAIALLLGALVAWLVGKWLKRARPAPPPPPPRPPWEVALEELFDVRHAGLVAEGRLAEHFDRVSDTVRKYLGARYGFDGLESTTREALQVLRKITPPVPLEPIENFLRQADLVKFAKTTPSAEDGELALVRAEHIVRNTLPTNLPAAPPADPSAADEDAGAPSPAETAKARAAADEAAIWGPKPNQVTKDAPETLETLETPGATAPKEGKEDR